MAPQQRHNQWSKELFGPRFINHAETAKHGVSEARTSRRDGLSRPAGLYLRELPAQIVVYRGVRFRTNLDAPLQADDQQE